jgi:hypothetical protein
MFELLTHQTTCASEMLEKTTCENFCQKGPPAGGGTSGQATRGMCHLGQRRQGGAAIPKVRHVAWQVTPSTGVSVAGHAAWRDADMIAWQPATNGGGGTPATCPDSDSHATLLQIGSFPRRLFANWKLWGYLPPHTRQPVVLIEKFAL